MNNIQFEPVEKNVEEQLETYYKRKNGFVRVNPSNSIMPKEYCEIADEILKCNVKLDDVWLLSFPRAGCTWTQEMVWLLANNFDYEGAKLKQAIRTPLLELTGILFGRNRDWLVDRNSVQMVQAFTNRRFLKSHLPWELLPEQINEVKPKIIYVARNPKDLCVSLYHYTALVHGDIGSFEDFCDIFLSDNSLYGSIWTHMLFMWGKRHEENILFLKYEDMKRDLTSTIYKCAKFLGVEKQIKTADVEKLCDHLNFDKMQKNKAVNLEYIIQPNTANGDEKNVVKFIRRGQIGDWKNFMSSEMSIKFDKWIKENTGNSDLEFCYE